MPIIDESILKIINTSFEIVFLSLIEEERYFELELYLEESIQQLHQSIPDHKRISYGITYVVKILAKSLFTYLIESEKDVLDIAVKLYENMTSFHTITIGLGVISHIGVIDVKEVLPYFEHASTHEAWEVREFAQMYLRKITKKNKVTIQNFLLRMSQSKDPNQRRFSSESLRPVAENKWINDDPEFSLKVLRQLFKESDPYPRVSVGNNLSDLSRKQPELIYEIIIELMSLNDDNATWIAQRASRNLIINDKIRVLDILGLDVYKYKTKLYKR